MHWPWELFSKTEIRTYTGLHIVNTQSTAATCSNSLDHAQDKPGSPAMTSIPPLHSHQVHAGIPTQASLIFWYLFLPGTHKWKSATTTKSLQSCLTLCDYMAAHQAPRPWDSPGKNTGVGCLFLPQCMKVKSEREVAQSCPTRSDPTDCSPPGSSVHEIFQARVLEWGATAFSKWRSEIILILSSTNKVPSDSKFH